MAVSFFMKIERPNACARADYTQRSRRRQPMRVDAKSSCFSSSFVTFIAPLTLPTSAQSSDPTGKSKIKEQVCMKKRRDFLKATGAALGGAAITGILSVEAKAEPQEKAAVGRARKGVVTIRCTPNIKVEAIHEAIKQSLGFVDALPAVCWASISTSAAAIPSRSTSTFLEQRAALTPCKVGQLEQRTLRREASGRADFEPGPGHHV
jgi:hypothetical protein